MLGKQRCLIRRLSRPIFARDRCRIDKVPVPTASPLVDPAVYFGERSPAVGSSGSRAHFTASPPSREALSSTSSRFPSWRFTHLPAILPWNRSTLASTPTRRCSVFLSAGIAGSEESARSHRDASYIGRRRAPAAKDLVLRANGVGRGSKGERKMERFEGRGLVFGVSGLALKGRLLTPG